MKRTKDELLTSANSEENDESQTEKNENDESKNLIVRLNVGGRVYEILSGKLCKYPRTRLGRLGTFLNGARSRSATTASETNHSECESCGRRQNRSESIANKDQACKIINELMQTNIGPTKRLASIGEGELPYDRYDAEKNEFFFDRDASMFDSILNMYRIDKLHFNDYVCPMLLKDELAYWKIECSKIDMCCRLKLSDKRKNIIEEIENENAILNDLVPKKETFKTCPKVSKKLWNLFEKPDYSTLSKIIHLISILFIVISTITLIMSTEVKVENLDKLDKEKPAYKNRLKMIEILNTIEMVCIGWFTFEFIIRLWSSPNKKKFFLDILNLIDLASVLPFYVCLFISDDARYKKLKSTFQVMRILRIFKLARHSNSLRTFGFVFKQSIHELGFLLILLSVNSLIFSSLTFYAEQDEEDTKFTSMTTSLWWAIVTITTVGYGDMSPATNLGKIFGGVCAIFGILTIAMPMAIISNNFSHYYKESTKRKQLMKMYNKAVLIANKKKKLTQLSTNEPAAQLGQNKNAKLSLLYETNIDDL